MEFPLADKALSREEYEQVLERIYLSAATEIYTQIEDDVKDKIALLPTEWYKAVALFYEAEDYARSGTLDANREAERLYEQCMRQLDVALWHRPETASRRFYWELHVARETIIHRGDGKGLAEWEEALFAAMERNAVHVSDFFSLPRDSVVEIGRQVAI